MVRGLLIVGAILLLASVALGQQSHGSRRHRRNADQPAAASGPVRTADARTVAFLHKADANGNGMIDEDEVSGAAKSIVEGILARLGVERKYPISLKNIAVATGSSRDDDSSSENASSSDSSTGAPSANGVSASKSPAATVPGFGQPNTRSDARKTNLVAASARADSRKPASSSAKPAEASANAPKRSGPKSGRFLTPRERLPKDLPAWFLEKDANRDGQVDMAEFTDEWTEALLVEFNRYDLNRDGVITPAECLKVENGRGRSK